jgi:hypothetical protein
MKDLVFFICFILVFLIGYSVTSYALITTDEQVFWQGNASESFRHEFTLLNNGTSLWDWELMRNLVQWGMWKVYGEVELEADHHYGDKTRIMSKYTLILNGINNLNSN